MVSRQARRSMSKADIFWLKTWYHTVSNSESHQQVLMAIELRNRLQTMVKVPISVPELLDVSIEQLAATLAARLVGERAVGDPVSAPVEEAIATDSWEEGTLWTLCLLTGARGVGACSARIARLYC